MNAESPREVEIDVEGCATVPGLLSLPPSAHACLVLAPGGTSDMHSPLLAEIARCLAARNVATLRYNFPYMQRMSRIIDPATTLQKTVVAAVEAARTLVPGISIFAGGRAFGAKTTSMAQARGRLDGLQGLVFIGFPLHPLTRRSTAAADHLSKVAIPMQFIQGTRDASADASLLDEVTQQLGRSASIHWIEDADHSFKKPGDGLRASPATADAIARAIDEWMRRHLMINVGALHEAVPHGAAHRNESLFS